MVSPQSRTTAKISVIVTLYNTAATIIDLVDDLLAQAHPDHPEQEAWLQVVLIDDCSRDATVGILELALAARGNPRHVHLHKNQQNLGLAQTLNRALDLCATEFILTY